MSSDGGPLLPRCNVDDRLGELVGVARAFGVPVGHSLSVIRINPSPVTRGPLGVPMT